MEQEEADRESLEPVAKELAHPTLLTHKDVGVRAWTACCIVDMFRLCAPDAPYTAAQLKVQAITLLPILRLMVGIGYLYSDNRENIPAPGRSFEPLQRPTLVYAAVFG